MNCRPGRCEQWPWLFIACQVRGRRLALWAHRSHQNPPRERETGSKPPRPGNKTPTGQTSCYKAVYFVYHYGVLLVVVIMQEMCIPCRPGHFSTGQLACCLVFCCSAPHLRAIVGTQTDGPSLFSFAPPPRQDSTHESTHEGAYYSYLDSGAHAPAIRGSPSHCNSGKLHSVLASSLQQKRHLTLTCVRGRKASMYPYLNRGFCTPYVYLYGLFARAWRGHLERLHDRPLPACIGTQSREQLPFMERQFCQQLVRKAPVL
jgi:hypothetical protein